MLNITPVFTKGDRNNETDYRLLKILSKVSKVYERCIYKFSAKFLNKIVFKNNMV